MWQAPRFMSCIQLLSYCYMYINYGYIKDCHCHSLLLQVVLLGGVELSMPDEDGGGESKDINDLGLMIRQALKNLN